jgi:hypothetical protein
MNVKELKHAIENLPDDMEVVLQKDSEGNGYSPCCGADPDSVYVPENAFAGYAYSMSWLASDACMEQEDWDCIRSKPRTLILFPRN